MTIHYLINLLLHLPYFVGEFLLPNVAELSLFDRSKTFRRLPVRLRIRLRLLFFCIEKTVVLSSVAEPKPSFFSWSRGRFKI